MKLDQLNFFYLLKNISSYNDQGNPTIGWTNLISINVSELLTFLKNYEK